jgi:hypothetical protein
MISEKSAYARIRTHASPRRGHILKMYRLDQDSWGAPGNLLDFMLHVIFRCKHVLFFFCFFKQSF